MPNMMIQLYNWEKGKTMIKTQYGHITYYRWLCLEEKRILKGEGRETHIRERPANQGQKEFSLWVDNQAEDHYDKVRSLGYRRVTR